MEFSRTNLPFTFFPVTFFLIEEPVIDVGPTDAKCCWGVGTGRCNPSYADRRAEYERIFTTGDATPPPTAHV
jgi:hypothetical protein